MARLIKRLGPLGLAVLLFAALPPANLDAQTTTTICGKKYVAGGDDVPAGNSIQSSQTYPSHLLNDHMAKFGYCLFNTAQNGTTSSTYISGGQLSTAWNRQPDFITLSVGEQNTPIVNAINSCFDNVKSHDFASALSCATSIQGNTAAFT